MRDGVYDVIVVGLGAMGSAATYHLAKRGARVLGLEMFQPGHDQGSSHGYHRMIRRSASPEEVYGPLAARAFALWRALEDEAGQPLLTMTGEVSLTDPASDPAGHSAVLGMIERGTRTRLDARDLAERFPGVRCPEGFLATYEAEAGFVRSELGIVNHVALAQRHGATVHDQEEVLRWMADGAGVRVETRQGAYRAGHLVITTGPWAAELLADLGLPLQVKRAVNGYFQPTRPDWWSVEQGAPDFLLDVPEGSYYGMPAVRGVGLKIGLSAHEPTTARTVRRSIDEAEIDRLRRVLDTYLPGASGPLARQITCMCTYTPDHDFVVGRHPDQERVLLACGFSGGGYKFSPVMGEVLADLALDGTTGFDVRAFSPDRFRAA